MSDGSPAIYAQSCSVALTQCELHGQASSTFLVPTSAMTLRNVTLHAASTTFVGGDASGNGGGFAAVYVPIASTLDLVDCVLQGGDTTQWGESALALPSGTARHQRCQFLSGTGPNGANPPIVALGSVMPAPLLGVEMAETSIALGATISPAYRSEPNGLVLVLAAFELQAPAPAPFVSPMHWGFGPTNAVGVAVLLGDTLGASSWSLAIPANPSLRDLGVWFTGVEFAASPLQLSPPVGGVIR